MTKDCLQTILSAWEARGKGERLAALAQGAGMTPHRLMWLTERFIAGGLDRVARASDELGWVQIGLIVSPQASAEAIGHSSLLAVVSRWQGEGLIRRFWFMRKPPGFRLRFEVPAEREDELRRAVEDLVRDLIASGACGGHELGIYDPEVFQFGGEAGLEVAHDWFAADSLLCLEYLRERAGGRAAPAPMVMGLMVTHHLFRGVCLDDWEAWDCWRRMDLAGRRPPVFEDTRPEVEKRHRAVRARLAALVAAHRELPNRLGGELGRMLGQWYEANRRATAGLAAAAKRGELLYGPRLIVPWMAIFHWNRLGLAIVDQHSLVYQMQALLDPKQER
ncbi:MAG: hypothetical protein HYV63_13810 [Candidatus Schekmanbacteria bacterium]|nr:hypothetical protein [Candidatus Schekmanbacteria bacterium]